MISYCCAFPLGLLQSTMNSVMGEWSALVLRAFLAPGSTKSPWSVVFRCDKQPGRARGSDGVRIAHAPWYELMYVICQQVCLLL